MSQPATDAPAECSACRGTGELISGLGGTPHGVPCAWCDGTGRFDPAHDAQASAREGKPADAAG